MLGFGDVEAEGVEGEVGGEPDVAAAVGGDAGSEGVGVCGAGGAVDAVGGDDEIVGGGEFGGGWGFGAEAEVYAEGCASLVEDFEESAAAECGESVSAGGEGVAAVDDVDGVPADELVLECAVDGGIGVFDAAEGFVGEDDAEAEGVVRGVAFPQ